MPVGRQGLTCAVFRRAHPATTQRPVVSSPDEKKLFDVITRAYPAALMPDFRYRQTTAKLDARGFEFRASGRQPIDLEQRLKMLALRQSLKHRLRVAKYAAGVIGWRAAFPDWRLCRIPDYADICFYRAGRGGLRLD